MFVNISHQGILFSFFYGKLYQQVGAVAMGFPLGPTLANIFLCCYEDIWLCDCSLECKPSYYKLYVDNIFVLFESETQVVQKFHEHLSS